MSIDLSPTSEERYRGSTPTGYDLECRGYGLWRTDRQTRKLRDELGAGDILQLTATDPGAPEDIPAWCRLTRNPLIYQEHPTYYIQAKEQS